MHDRYNTEVLHALQPVLRQLDLKLESGSDIPIEQRPASEVTHVFGTRLAPEGTAVENPAFDVTPNRYVAAIITERGVARQPYRESLAKLAG